MVSILRGSLGSVAPLMPWHWSLGRQSGESQAAICRHLSITTGKTSRQLRYNLFSLFFSFSQSSGDCFLYCTVVLIQPQWSLMLHLVEIAVQTDVAAPVANIPRECREGRTAFPPSFPGLFSASWNVDNLLHESKPSNKPFPGVAEK